MLVCKDCSNETSREVPGYEDEIVRVCRCCFVQFYAVIVVWHSWFSYKHKLVSGVEAAKKAFDKLSNSSSRIAVRMADGCVIDSWFKNDSWQQRIINRTQSHRRDIMSQNARIIVAPLPPAGLANPNPALYATTVVSATAPPSGTAQPLPAGQPQPITGIQQQPNSASRRHPPNHTYLNCYVVYRRTPKDPILHAWIEVPSEPEFPEMVAVVSSILEKASVQDASVLTGDGRILFLIDNSKSFAPLAQESLKSCPVVVAWQAMDGTQMTRQATYGELLLVTSRLDSRLPWVAIDELCGDVLAYRNCSISTLDVLSRTAGGVSNKLFAACTTSDVKPKVKLFNNSYVAHKELRDREDGILYLCPPNDAAPILISAHPSIDLDNAAKCVVPHVTAALSAQQRVVPPTIVDDDVRQETLNCPICIERYTTEERRPCICGSCGNTICLGCITSLRNCPYCRHEFNATARPPTNVALLALVEAQGRPLGSQPQSPLSQNGSGAAF